MKILNCPVGDIVAPFGAGSSAFDNRRQFPFPLLVRALDEIASARAFYFRETFLEIQLRAISAACRLVEFRFFAERCVKFGQPDFELFPGRQGSSNCLIEGARRAIAALGVGWTRCLVCHG
jgi:hypothetical protein